MQVCFLFKYTIVEMHSVMKRAPPRGYLGKAHVLEGFSPLSVVQMFCHVKLLRWWNVCGPESSNSSDVLAQMQSSSLQDAE